MDWDHLWTQETKLKHQRGRPELPRRFYVSKVSAHGETLSLTYHPFSRGVSSCLAVHRHGLQHHHEVVQVDEAVLVDVLQQLLLHGADEALVGGREQLRE